jgi:hypothetical protein
MNVNTGKGSWAPVSQASKPAAPSQPPADQLRERARPPASATQEREIDASEAHALLQPLLRAENSDERAHHARALSVTLSDDSVARMSLCHPDALTKLLRMLQFEIPADEAFFLLTCLTHLLVEESAQICCIYVPFCIPMLIQRAAKWNQISNQQHPNICFAALVNLCLQEDGCNVCSRSGVFRCLASALSAKQDHASHYYCMRLLSCLLCHPVCSATILKHADLLPHFFKSMLADDALDNPEAADSAAVVLRCIYEVCR